MTRLYETFLRKAPRQMRSRGVVESILEAAVEIAARSLDELSLAETAKRAGVGIGSLYDYFTDRESLVAALAAKITEDNVERFREVLERTRGAPLDTMIEALVDHAIDTYARRPGLCRTALVAAHRAGLMPSLAANQAAFSRALAAHLRERPDVRADLDVDAFSFVAVNGVMGLVQALIWLDRPPAIDALRDETVRLLHADLTRDAR